MYLKHILSFALQFRDFFMMYFTINGF